METLKKLASALNVSIYELVRRKPLIKSNLQGRMIITAPRSNERMEAVFTKRYRKDKEDIGKRMN